jgi:uncharacterized RDD family membrane protein YckC
MSGSLILGLLYFIDRHLTKALLKDHLELCFALVWGVILAKDIIDGQSMSKKLLGLQVLDRRTNQAPHSLLSILRNAIALLLFPIEVLTYLLSNRRIGDRVCNTQVVAIPRKSVSQMGQEIVRTPTMNIVMYLGVGVTAAYLEMVLYETLLFGILNPQLFRSH